MDVTLGLGYEAADEDGAAAEAAAAKETATGGGVGISGACARGSTAGAANPPVARSPPHVQRSQLVDLKETKTSDARQRLIKKAFPRGHQR
jgi:hypothetical protein